MDTFIFDRHVYEMDKGEKRWSPFYFAKMMSRSCVLYISVVWA
jgi:hypothetical protein